MLTWVDNVNKATEGTGGGRVGGWRNGGMGGKGTDDSDLTFE